MPTYEKIATGTILTIKASGGDATITLAGHLDNGARQSTSLDFGALWDREWWLESALEFAPTPNAGQIVELRASWSNTTGAGQANTSGVDELYAGYAANIIDSLKQLDDLGPHICTTNTEPTLQKAFVGLVYPKARYMNLVVHNLSGIAFGASDTNMAFTFTAKQASLEDTP